MVNSKTIKLLISILVFFGFSTIYGQNEALGIQATIIDTSTNQPLPFTNVHVEGTSIGTISNEDGKFELLVKQKYASNNVIFSFIGFDNTYKKVEDLSLIHI